MRKLFSTGLAIMVLACATIFIGSSTQVYAQAFKEPMLDGIPYSEMNEWSYRYGGGAMYGGACPPMPQAGMWYSGPPTYMGPPPFSKKKARSRRK